MLRGAPAYIRKQVGEAGGAECRLGPVVPPGTDPGKVSSNGFANRRCIAGPDRIEPGRHRADGRAPASNRVRDRDGRA